ncbi:MAG TPA: hypothetical protein VIX38_05930 [Nitrososphaeraceae archaeon]
MLSQYFATSNVSQNVTTIVDKVTAITPWYQMIGAHTLHTMMCEYRQIVLAGEKYLPQQLLQRIVTVSNNSLTFHYYATSTFLLYAMTCFFMFTDRADARLFSNNPCAILLSAS